MAPANNTLRSCTPAPAEVSAGAAGRRGSADGDAANRRESETGVLGAIFMRRRKRKRNATSIGYINSRTCGRRGPSALHRRMGSAR
jgi:hypothetical protein